MICLDAFKNLYIEETGSLRVSPCCLVKPETADPVNFYSSPLNLKIRNDFLAGRKPSECADCWKKESAGHMSRRMGSELWYKEHGYTDADLSLVRLDYWTGNTCNLQCVTCGPLFSSSWQKELGILHKDTLYSNKFWKNIDLTNIRFIHFNGGEPLLSKTHVQLLKDIPNKSIVQLNYNTNGTIYPSSELVELWSKFELVKLDFSIDDIGNKFEYIRFPANWDHTVETLNRFKTDSPVNCMFAINTTISLLNLYSYPELVTWVNANFSSNRLGDQVELRWQWANGTYDCKTMPISQRDLLFEKYKDSEFSNILNGISFVDSNSPIINKIAFLETLDNRRNTDYKITFPHLTLSQ